MFLKLLSTLEAARNEVDALKVAGFDDESGHLRIVETRIIQAEQRVGKLKKRSVPPKPPTEETTVSTSDDIVVSETVAITETSDDQTDTGDPASPE